MSLNVIITSDLHLTLSAQGQNKIVPLAPYGKALLACMVSEMIDLNPDVVIMTGDNTNDGKPEEYAALLEALQRLKEHGIAVVIVPGNHDFHRSSPDAFRYLRNFCHVTHKDPYSLSYTSEFDGVTFFAMDDSSHELGVGGSLSEHTLRWLKKQLEKANKNHQLPIFLSHHNVFEETWQGHPEFYQIQAPGLEELLKSHGCCLALSGHQHLQTIRKHENLYEITSAIPLTGRHLYGLLTVNQDRLTYHTQSFAFERYADLELWQIIQEKDMLEKQARILMFEQMAGEASNLLESWYEAVEAGQPDQAVDKLRLDPHYPLLLAKLGESAHGRWVKAWMSERILPADHLCLDNPNKY